MGVHPTRPAVAVAVVTALALSACGSNDSGSDSPDPADRATDQDVGDVAAANDSVDGASDSADPGVPGAPGGGTVTVDGVAYMFDTEVCLFQESGFFVAGPGSDPDGNPGYVNVEGSSETDFDGDGEPDEEIMVSVEVGAAQMGMGTEDQPYFFVSAWGDTLAEQITFERTNNSVSGSGTLTDNNSVVAEYDESIPFEFEAGCG